MDGQLDVRSWAVLDISGRTVISGEDYLPEVIDVARWSNGKYFLRITTDQNTEVLPFVVQH
ncbi:MAG: T9SS type A sorting domain-containing protein [Flavobacteriales bacterium]|nr:T9SS type A sorting domain-containing protein [Flavobacteriales bacterium]